MHKVRVRVCPHLRQPRAGRAGDIRLHRGILKPRENPLGARLAESQRVRESQLEWPHAGGIGPVNENGTDSDPDLVSPSNHGSAFFSAAMCPCGQQAAHISHGPSGTSPVSVRTPRARYPWPPSALRSSWRGHCRLHKVRRLNDLPLQLRDLLVAISQHRTVLRIGLGNNIGNLTGCLEPTPSICCFSCCSSCSLTCASSLWSPCALRPSPARHGSHRP